MSRQWIYRRRYARSHRQAYSMAVAVETGLKGSGVRHLNSNLSSQCSSKNTVWSRTSHFNLSDPWFPQLEKGDSNCSYLESWWKLRVIMHVDCLAQCLAYRKGSINVSLRCNYCWLYPNLVLFTSAHQLKSFGAVFVCLFVCLTCSDNLVRIIHTLSPCYFYLHLWELARVWGTNKGCGIRFPVFEASCAIITLIF